MSYHVMTSGRGVGFGALAGAGLGQVTSMYSKAKLEPPSLQNEMQSTSFNSGGEDFSSYYDQPSSEDANKKKLIIGASIVGGVVVIAGVAALAMRK